MRVVVPVLIVLAFIIYTLVAVVQSNSERIRRLPKAVWVVVVVFLPVLGALAWWIWGQPTGATPPPPTAPDDDPDFLRSINH